jgi:hypothetical protein
MTAQSSKKSRAIPTFAAWDWSQADVIDEEMCRAHLKKGVPAGYLLWDEIEVTLSDVLECAVDSQIFPGKPRMLALLKSAGELDRWEPDRATSWYESITNGQTLDEIAPMLLRPAVSGESPARWYIEDGSGRAIRFRRKPTGVRVFGPSQTLAIGYLGCNANLRHRGIGTQLAEKVWLHCPGRWQIRVMEKNVLARKFWESSIAKFTGEPAQTTHFVKDGVAWHRFSLDSRR